MKMLSPHMLKQNLIQKSNCLKRKFCERKTSQKGAVTPESAPTHQNAWNCVIVVIVIVMNITVINLIITIITTTNVWNLCDEVGEALGRKQKDRLVDVPDPWM